MKLLNILLFLLPGLCYGSDLISEVEQKLEQLRSHISYNGQDLDDRTLLRVSKNLDNLIDLTGANQVEGNQNCSLTGSGSYSHFYVENVLIKSSTDFLEILDAIENANCKSNQFSTSIYVSGSTDYLKIGSSYVAATLNNDEKFIEILLRADKLSVFDFSQTKTSLYASGNMSFLQIDGHYPIKTNNGLFFQYLNDLKGFISKAAVPKTCSIHSSSQGSHIKYGNQYIYPENYTNELILERLEILKRLNLCSP